MANSQYNQKKELPSLKSILSKLPVPFKIYADFECNLRGVKSYEG